MSGESYETSLAELRIGGTEVHYYVLCPRKLWWFSHGMEQEHVDGAPAAENVALGTLLHETSYPDRGKKNIMIDGLLRLDFTESGAVHEVKKSRGAVKATRFQLLYYLYYLKHEKGIEKEGVIDYPKERRREEVKLTPSLEAAVADVIQGVLETRARPTPPEVPARMAICARCAYEDLCWG